LNFALLLPNLCWFQYWFACVNRANLSTCPAVCAKFWVNYIRIAFAYCAFRTFRQANPAANAIICNVIGHKIEIIGVRLKAEEKRT